MVAASSSPCTSGSSVSWSPITSSLTNSLNPASRASRAYRLGSRWYRTPACLVRSRSTRRTATVTISAPDASMARTIVSLSRYLPVPTMRREWKVRPPMVNGVSRSVSTAVAIGSPPSHEMHQLDRVPRSYSDLAQRGPADDGAVVLHHDGARVELERSEQLEQRHAPRYRAALPVQRDIDRVAHCVSSCAILRAVAAGSAASHKARIAATP